MSPATFHTVTDDVPLRILPLGDSITAGTLLDGQNSYRPYLRDLLLGSGHSVAYIGSMVSGDHIDNHHEGHGGMLIKEIQEKVAESQILREQPNVILLHAGTNDMNSNMFGGPPQDPYETAPDRLQTLIDYCFCECPEATLILAQIIDNRSDAEGHERVQVFNAEVKRVAVDRRAKGQKVLIADHSHVGSERSDLGQDGVHPLVVGYEKMAQAWFEAMQDIPEAWVQQASSASPGQSSSCARFQDGL
ncbi:Multidomain esterase, partial [Pseudocercospora fuligena]